MNKINLLGSKALFLLAIVFLSMVSSCNDSGGSNDKILGNWVKQTSFRGKPRQGAVTFTIGDKSYVGLGYDGSNYLTDFYVFDVALGYWQPLANFPGKGREAASAFSVNGKGYVGIGRNRNENVEQLKDFWQYDPVSNTWTQLKDFGGTARYNAVSFSVGSKGYIGTGYDGDSYYSDFWQYLPSDDSWREIVSFPGEKRERATAFVIENKAYICGGMNNGTNNLDFWSFDVDNEAWSNLRPSTDKSYYTQFSAGVRRADPVSFSLNGKGYVGLGVVGGSLDNSVYEFNPGDNSWTKKTNFEGAARQVAVSYVIGGRAFVGTGYGSSRRYDDIWEFLPAADYNQND